MLNQTALQVPAPWGVGIMLGLKRDWVCSGSMDQAPGPGTVLEVRQLLGGARYLGVWRQLDSLARRQGWPSLAMAAPICAFLPGLAGWVDLVDVLPHPHESDLSLWLLARPRPAWLQPLTPQAPEQPGGSMPLHAPAWPAGATLVGR
jgi:hypothetical protein